MSHHTQFDNDDDDNEELSSNENDDDFEADIQALSRACMVTNPDSTDFNSMTTATADAGDGEAAHYETDSDDDDDIALVRDLKNRLSITEDLCEPLSMKPMCALPPEFSDDDDEDDFEILRAIHRRFLAYDNGTLKNNSEEILWISEQVHASSTNSEMENYNNMCVNICASEGFPDSKDAGSINYLLSDNVENQPSGSDECYESDAQRSSMWPIEHSSFPKSAQLFVDAIKRNRSYQKFLRNKFTEIEARIEENKELRERIKVLKDFQVSCRKITRRSLSQMKDPRVQLISAQKFGTSKDSEVDDKKNVSMNYGPAENSQVGKYILALIKCPLTFRRKKWSKAEKENLGKGIRQQFQETVLQVSVDQFGGSDGSSGDKNSIDNILASIKDLEITPEKIREFLPKVNWDQLSSSYVAGRTGTECEARWLNCEDPLINRNPWTVEEDKNLLFIVQEKGITNWFDIAVLLGTNRTPFQCLKRYQRSLNASILKREWTAEEDEKLRIAVEAFGESNWQPVASALKGRTGTQCANRWSKSLHPARQRVGRWTLDEDKRLKVAVMLFGPKSWRKIAQFVPGRTQVQCRERWVNALDPSLNFGEWTEDEDSRLIAAIQEHRHCWSKVAACMPSRTDSQCLRRWKVLLPDEVPLLQEARRMQKAALICNFVDRELERPALGPNDFVPLPTIGSVSEPEFENSLKKRKRKSR
ncbi:Myb_DNA-binding domain-containing protein/Myb_DNA-bind_6 domain-containing protein, partial [Cephalotus follicularis]